MQVGTLSLHYAHLKEGSHTNPPALISVCPSSPTLPWPQCHALQCFLEDGWVSNCAGTHITGHSCKATEKAHSMSALSLRSTLHGCVPSDHQRCIIPKQKAPPRVGACLTVPDASRLISTQWRGSQHQSSRMACSLNKGLGASVAMQTWVKGPIRQLAIAQSLMADQLAPAQIQARENHSTLSWCLLYNTPAAECSED